MGDSGKEFRVYEATCRGPFRRSFTAKILGVCFVGIHIPLILCSVAVPVFSRAQISLSAGFTYLLVATLIGTLAALSVLAALLRPLKAMAQGLKQFDEQGKVPEWPRGFDDEVGQLMRETRNLLETVAQKEADLIEQATHEPVSGFLNRRGWEMESLRFDDAFGPRAVIVFDIDDLKSINHEHGHHVGDQAIARLADAVRFCAPSPAVIARWTGLEAIVLVFGDESFAECFAQKVTETLASQPLEVLPGIIVDLSVSCGIACSPSQVHPDQLLDLALLRLRRVKRLRVHGALDAHQPAA